MDDKKSDFRLNPYWSRLVNIGGNGVFDMSEISVIGLGAMGSALARALLQADHHVTVWNRTAAKMEPLVALGAKGATSIGNAVRASSLVMVCVVNYSATKSLFGAKEVTAHLSGRTLIQLSTGTPREARESETWARDCGAGYVDGAIMAYARGIGSEDTLIFISGSQTAFARCQPYLACLGGDLRYLGETVGAAAAIDLAQHCYYLGGMIGLVHGALLCESEKIGVDLLASSFGEGELAKKLSEIIHKNAYGQSESTINLWEGAVQRIQSQARDARMNIEFPDFVSGIFRRAVAAGHGDKDTAALIKVLRTERGT